MKFFTLFLLVLAAAVIEAAVVTKRTSNLESKADANQSKNFFG